MRSSLGLLREHLCYLIGCAVLIEHRYGAVLIVFLGAIDQGCLVGGGT
jgi:hypothetical protein